MAESGYTTTSWDPMSTSSGASAPSEWTAPLHHVHALSFPQPHAPLPYNYNAHYAYMSNPQMIHYPDTSNIPFHGQNHSRTPYSPTGGNQMNFPPLRMPPHDPSQARPPPALRHERNTAREESGGYMGINGLHTRVDYSRESFYPPGYSPSLPSGWNLSSTARRPHSSTMGSSPPQYARQDLIPSPGSGTVSSPIQTPGVSRRLTLHGSLPSMFMDGQGRHPDGSLSPRTSHRRSFDRYSVDLSHSSTSSDADEIAARIPPSSRVRHRIRGARFLAQRQLHDPSIPSEEQIQELKGKLPRRLAGELAEATDKTCDICAKDYSNTAVTPSEDAEVALELPCGHFFGEFCIQHWFDTCKAQKNKVTCPMCRKQLLEPCPPPPRPMRNETSRYHHALYQTLHRHGHLSHPYAPNVRGDLSGA